MNNKRDAQAAKEHEEKKAQQKANKDQTGKVQAIEERETKKEEHPSMPDNAKEEKFPLKDFSIEKILSMASPGVYNLGKQISDLVKARVQINSEIAKAQKSLRHVNKVDRKLGLEDKEKLSSERRSSLEFYIGHMKTKRIRIDDKIKGLKKEYSNAARKEKTNLTLEQLKSKADSEAYISRNQYMITKSLLTLLNSILSGEDIIKKTSFENVCKLSFKGGEEGKADFNLAFAELLSNTNLKTFILVSGKLKERLYGAAKLTLQMWNPQVSRPINFYQFSRFKSYHPFIFYYMVPS